MLTLEQYRQALASHDWTFEYSDEHARWKQGSEQRYALVKAQLEHDRDGQIWNEYAPADMRVRPTE